MYGTTVTRGAAHTQYTVRIPKYSAQYRPHVIMFASSTAQACNIHCHVFKHRSSYVCALVLIVNFETKTFNLASLNDKNYSSTSAQEQREGRLQRRRERERAHRYKGYRYRAQKGAEPACEHAARGGGSRPLHLRPVDTNKIGLQNDGDRHNTLPLLTMKSQR